MQIIGLLNLVFDLGAVKHFSSLAICFGQTAFHNPVFQAESGKKKETSPGSRLYIAASMSLLLTAENIWQECCSFCGCDQLLKVWRSMYFFIGPTILLERCCTNSWAWEMLPSKPCFLCIPRPLPQVNHHNCTMIRSVGQLQTEHRINAGFILVISQEIQKEQTLSKTQACCYPGDLMGKLLIKRHNQVYSPTFHLLAP